MDEGSVMNPIEVLDQEEQLQINKKRLQYEKNRQMLYEAHMGTRFDVLITVMKLKAEGSQQDKKRSVNQRIKQFLNKNSKRLNVEKDHFRKRRQPDYTNQNTKPISNQLILFGVDFLNTKQIIKKFTGFKVKVQWLDQSHCKVQFQDAQHAKEALELNLKNINQLLVKIQNQQMQVPRCWFQLHPYFYFTFERKLFCRYLTTQQDNIEKQKSNDYYIYQDAKKKFQQQIGRQYKNIYYELMVQFKLINSTGRRQALNTNRNRNYRDRRDVGEYRQGRNMREDRNGRQRGNYNNNQRNYRGHDRYEQNNRWQRNGDNNRGYNNNNRNNNLTQNSTVRYEKQNRNRLRNTQNNSRDQERLSLASSDSRSRQKNNNKDDENLSISISKRSYKPRKFSESICSQSPVRIRNQQIQDDNLSFILNKDQIQKDANKFITHFSNLSLIENQNDVGYKNQKQQQLSLSFLSNHGSALRNQNNEGMLNTSLNESKIIEKKKQLNTSLIQDRPIEYKPNKRMNLSIIQQITILD